MAIVAGVDFGTLSVRVSIVDSERGLLATSLAEYPLHRKREDPEYATQSHDDQMRALAGATREAVRKAGIGGGHQVRLAFRRWETFSTPLPLALEPMSRRRAKDW
jgi:L-ribulokinase